MVSRQTQPLSSNEEISSTQAPRFTLKLDCLTTCGAISARYTCTPEFKIESCHIRSGMERRSSNGDHFGGRLKIVSYRMMRNSLITLLGIGYRVRVYERVGSYCSQSAILAEGNRNHGGLDPEKGHYEHDARRKCTCNKSNVQKVPGTQL